ncbi:hypothetical protein [Magnetospirillum aberrantis]|uniref:Helix-turn-helix domain-containing protein n=1 Tax=Magnetospirillum aberrantis SpK TaxID=908842 RepID=A0A7C9QTY1_9PROT|nr:hypothetical protein [Magnetospirillum aberrantis]NFV80061.1 hypothetical protein [Magnetospirillum aberrantis SpK]
MMAAALKHLENLPNWPRLMSVDQAAAYCGLSGEAFRQHVTVQPLRFGRRVLYDRMKIDSWLDEISSNGGVDVDAMIEALGK